METQKFLIEKLQNLIDLKTSDSSDSNDGLISRYLEKKKKKNSSKLPKKNNK